MKRVMLGVAMACSLAGAGSMRAQQPDEREAVKAAVLDYVEAIYQAQPDRIQRSVHTDLAKVSITCTSRSTTGSGRS